MPVRWHTIFKTWVEDEYSAQPVELFLQQIAWDGPCGTVEMVFYSGRCSKCGIALRVAVHTQVHDDPHDYSGKRAERWQKWIEDNDLHRIGMPPQEAPQ